MSCNYEVFLNTSNSSQHPFSYGQGETELHSGAAASGDTQRLRERAQSAL